MIWKTTLVLFTNLLYTVCINAQNATAFELDEYISQSSNKKVASISKNSRISITPLEVLAYNLVPTVFIEDNQVKTFDEQLPIKAESSYASFSSLSTINPLFNKVELLVIKLDAENQLNPTLDFSKLLSFTSLKYVYFVCPFNCSNSQIEQIVRDLPSKITLLYSASIPE